VIDEPLITKLFERIPEPGTYWPEASRQKWLSAIEAMFDMLYLDQPEVIFVPKAACTDEQREAIRRRGPGNIEVIRPEMLQINSAPHEELDAKAAEPVTHDDNHEPFNHSPHPGQAAQADAKPVSPKLGRPAGVPSNLAMALAAITHFDGKAGSTQIRDFVKKKWWPGVPNTWSNCLWGLVEEGKLARDGVNFVQAKSKVSVTEVAKRVDTKRAPAPRPIPVVATPRGSPGVARERHADGEEFQWKDNSVPLQPKEYLIASRLRAAMGKGHIGVQFLAENALGMRRGQGEEAKLTLRQLATAMGDRLASLGLSIEYHEGFGFLMKEI
jgi:hypothetical protein